MNISYQRGMQKNFMIIDPEESDWDGYECRMLLHNNIDGLLKMRVRPTENGPRFYYDITSRQPLSRMIKGAQWGAGEFRSFMIQICEMIGRMETYLLKESGILLDPDQIYLEPESGRLSFCYVPGMEHSFPEDLGKLLERLLECVNHRDKECVVLAYGLYQETRKENYGTEDLLRLVYAGPAGGETQKPCEYALEVDEFPAGITDVKEEKPPGFFEKLKDKVFTYLTRQEDDADDENSWFEGPDETVPEENAVRREAQKDQAGEVRPEMVKIPSGTAALAAAESAVEYSEKDETALRVGDTMILSDLKTKLGIHILRALNAGMADIPISYYPFVIGKQESLVDFRLEDDSVSRLHLKIEKKGERYIIEDLNSTNGTTLNGQLLENNEEREINPGDEIGIARLRFLFE